MFILPVKIDETGTIMVDGDVPSDAVCTVMDATGCRVYLPEDKELLQELFKEESE